MIKLWRVALHEYKRHVFNRRFLLGLFSVPLIVAVMIGLVFILINLEINTTPIGYVDHSGLLANPIPPPPPEKPDKPVPMLAFIQETAAQAALEAGKIQAYYVLPEDYLTTGKIKVVHTLQVKQPARQQFYAFLAANLLADTPPEIARRLLDSGELVVQSPDGSRQVSSQGWFAILIPFLTGIAFIVAIFSTGGYLMQAVVDEKENRTMEVIMTSVSPNQFMAGKIIADIAVGLTQILGWIGFIVIAILAGDNYMGFLKGIAIPWQTIILSVAVMLPAFVMVAALMAAVGATLTEAREGQQVIGILSLPIWIPYMLTGALMGNPNGPLAVGLSLFPFTSPLTMLIRAGVTIVPLWQVAACVAILTFTALGAIWLAGRAFRLGMLRYSKRLTWREVFERQGAKS